VTKYGKNATTENTNKINSQIKILFFWDVLHLQYGRYILMFQMNQLPLFSGQKSRAENMIQDGGEDRTGARAMSKPI
jgi:hypothetical protein